MTRTECENRLLELVRQADAIYHQLAPEGGRLSMTVCEGHIDIVGWRNDCDEDSKHLEDKHHVYCTQFQDGQVWHMDKWNEVMEEESA